MPSVDRVVIDPLMRYLGPGWQSFVGIFIVTNLGLLAVGATLPVIPRFVTEELNGSDLEVGIVTGAFAITGFLCRPLAGNAADRRGRRVTVIAGASLAVIAGALLFLPASIPGLIVSRLFLGAGEGTVFTAGSAWNVDMAPPERRGRMIGLYGLAIWTGLTLGPPVGELLLHVGGYELVWAFATGAPVLAAVIASRLPESVQPEGSADARGPIISREAAGPGGTFALGVVGIAMGAAFSLLFPALSLLAVNRVVPERRGAAMGTFTASFDLGMLVGSPAVGAAAAIGGYSAAFYLAAAAALACAALSLS